MKTHGLTVETRHPWNVIRSTSAAAAARLALPTSPTSSVLQETKLETAVFRPWRKSRPPDTRRSSTVSALQRRRNPVAIARGRSAPAHAGVSRRSQRVMRRRWRHPIRVVFTCPTASRSHRQVSYKLRWLAAATALRSQRTRARYPSLASWAHEHRAGRSRRARSHPGAVRSCSATPSERRFGLAGARTEGGSGFSTSRKTFSWWDYRQLALPEEPRPEHRPHSDVSALAAACIRAASTPGAQGRKASDQAPVRGRAGA